MNRNENNNFTMLLNKDYLFVIIQGILFLCYLFLPDYKIALSHLSIPGLVTAIIGIAISMWSLINLGSNLTPFPTPKTNSTLIKHGAFRYARHPIYSSILLAGFGFGMYLQDVVKVGVSLLLLVLFFYKSKYEEGLLIKKFGVEYTEYMKSTGRFFTI